MANYWLNLAQSILVWRMETFFSIDAENSKSSPHDDDGGNGRGTHQSILHDSRATRSANGEMRAPPLPSNDFAQELEAKFLT